MRRAAREPRCVATATGTAAEPAFGLRFVRLAHRPPCRGTYFEPPIYALCPRAQHLGLSAGCSAVRVPIQNRDHAAAAFEAGEGISRRPAQDAGTFRRNAFAEAGEQHGAAATAVGHRNFQSQWLGHGTARRHAFWGWHGWQPPGAGRADAALGNECRRHVPHVPAPAPWPDGGAGLDVGAARRAAGGRPQLVAEQRPAQGATPEQPAHRDRVRWDLVPEPGGGSSPCQTCCQLADGAAQGCRRGREWLRGGPDGAGPRLPAAAHSERPAGDLPVAV
mmetsp:Transcript_57855/g.152299  ORF Transcript_57855/g.152299 Transcript_57855/m.152299 type:complete len:277 (+) Transcript_57855:262-1092(+)